MIRLALLSLTLSLLHPPEKVRVATYSNGKINSKEYKGFSFWIKDNKRAYIRYAAGKDNDSEDIDLTYLGTHFLNGEKSFKVQFPAPDSNCLYIIQNKYALKVSDRTGKQLGYFTWENETRGASDSTITCSFCARDEKDAMNILDSYFFR
ncbi:hypothetical protein ACX0G9_06225 [Flavitalea flava]